MKNESEISDQELVKYCRSYIEHTDKLPNFYEELLTRFEKKISPEIIKEGDKVATFDGITKVLVVAWKEHGEYFSGVQINQSVFGEKGYYSDTWMKIAFKLVKS